MPPRQEAPAPAVFTAEANRHLRNLATHHEAHLVSGNDDAVLTTTQAAATIRRAAVVYVAANEILPAVALRDSSHLAREADYLHGLVNRLWYALREGQISNLAILSDAAQAVLDGFEAGENGLFEEMAVVPFSVEGAQVGMTVGRRAQVEVVSAGQDRSQQPHQRDGPSSVPSVTSLPNDFEPQIGQEQPSLSARDNNRGRSLRRILSTASDSPPPGSRKWRCSFCGLSFSGLEPRDKLILWLYILMVLLSLGAITAVTVDFVRQQITPGSFIRSEITTSLPAPVVTVCLSQRGVPFSRLQLFNFTDAEGENFRGADPRGPQKERQDAKFELAVDRFWDNPGNEDCDRVVGDFFPFPLESLNNITSGAKTTMCRPCYRVGRKEQAIVRSTEFQNSSVLSFYTDNYFLQCMKRAKGLNDESLTFLHNQLVEKKKRMFELGVLSYPGGSVDALDLENFTSIDSGQACNIFYFAFFPKELKRDTDDVDIRYQYDDNANNWTAIGRGPYFNLRETQDFLPEESLQMFVSTNASTKVGQIGDNQDVILIGPNTQTYATFRPIVVYRQDRYDISSSTTNFVQSAVTPIFGYWLVYRIFYNYNRFVTDEYYQESTYPASQWIVDLTGYASLFTGASLFSILLLPLLRAMRKREKQRLIKQQPEVYLWSQHKQRYQEATRARAVRPVTANPDISDGGNQMRGTSVMLPGYNV